MFDRLRREYTQLVTSGAQLLLLFVGIQFESRNGWLICLAIMACLSLFAWLSALHRLRSIRGTPTSRIASAAQGYVELVGRGHPCPDIPLISKLRGLPCLWYRYRIERRNGKNEWHTVDRGESSDLFVIRDDSGECMVDPESAEIITRHRDRWQEGDHRYTEWKLIEYDPVYILGEFRTRNAASEFDSRTRLSELLGAWKRDKASLHARFDLDGNGELDMEEWMLARQAAKREVDKMRREAQAQADLHLVAAPLDGKLFLISNLTPDRLSRRYLFWSWAHLAIFFGSLSATGWLMQTPSF